MQCGRQKASKEEYSRQKDHKSLEMQKNMVSFRKYSRPALLLNIPENFLPLALDLNGAWLCIAPFSPSLFLQN